MGIATRHIVLILGGNAQASLKLLMMRGRGGGGNLILGGNAQASLKQIVQPDFGIQAQHLILGGNAQASLKPAAP